MSDAISEIKARINIVDFIGRYASLQKAGRNYKAVCPFHTERTPSFIVFPDRQTWHCFGACGVGGDILSFIMRKESLDFAQALRQLAEELGIALPERNESRNSDALERLRKANEEAADFYHRTLSEPAGKVALAYLERRGLDEPMIRSFQLGYSPDGWDGLRNHLKQNGYSEQEMLSAGLLVEGDRGQYDRFRHRLMFPIRDVNGRVVGFGGRSLPRNDGEEAQPKYLNTPQTDLFDKGGLLYALDRAREQIRLIGQAVIVEGYMDVIAAHQNGVGNVVASMGTALTKQQVNLLRRYTNNLALALDADPAGIEAALRILEGGDATLGLESTPVVSWSGMIRGLPVIGVDAKVIPLFAGKDPDEFIRSDVDGWHRAVESALPMVDFVMQAIVERTDRSSATGKSEVVKRLLPLIGFLADPVVQAHYVQKLATTLGLREDVIMTSLRQSQMQSRRRTERLEPQQQAVQQPRSEPVEEYLLSLLLRYPTLKKQEAQIQPEVFWSSENRQVFEAWRRSDDEDSLRKNLSEELYSYLGRLWSKNVPPFVDDQEITTALNDCLRGLERRRLMLVKEANVEALANSKTSVDVEEAIVIAKDAWRTGQSVDGDTADSPAAVAALLIKDARTGLQIHGSGVQERIDNDPDKSN